jgi:hypothetical protein
MDPKSPQGTLGQIADNPLVASALGRPMDQSSSATPNATDTAASPTGSPIPQPGAPPRSPINGGASMAQMLMAKGQPTPTAFRSAHVEKIGDNAAQAIKTNPEAAQKPGGWAKALVGGAVDALKGISAVGDLLGDVAAVGTVPAGAGALTGIARTMQARQQRMRQGRLDVQEENKNKVMMAEANTRMIHEQRLVHELDDKAKQSSVDSGLRQIDTLKKQASPAPPLAQHLDSDQAAQFLKDKKWDATEHTPIPDGIKTTGTDKDGNPITRITYSIMGVPSDVDLDPEKDKDVLAELNKFAPPANGGKWGQDGKQHMTGVEFNLAMQHANDVRAATQATQKAIVDSKAADEDIAKRIEAQDFGSNTTIWVNALSHAPNGDPMAARSYLLQQMKTNPELANKWPNLDNDLREKMGKNDKGEYVFDKMILDYQKKADDRLEILKKENEEVDKAHGEDAASMATGYRDKAEQTSDPQLKNQYTLWANTLEKKAKASLDYAADKKTREGEAESKASEGDLSSLKDMVLHYEYEPDKLFARFKGIKQKQEFIAQMHRDDPTWSEAEYKKRYATKQDFRAEGKGGLMVQSLNYFAGHLDAANDLIAPLQNTNSKYLNMPLNKIKGAGAPGEAAIGRYKLALDAAKKEYENFLLNNHAQHEIDKEAMAKLVDENTTPAAAQGILRQMAHTVAVRARSLNARYRNDIKENIPEFIEPQNEAVFRTFGIDPQKEILGSEGPKRLPQGLPKPVAGMTRITTPNGTPMDFPTGSDQLKQAIANGAVTVTQ